MSSSIAYAELPKKLQSFFLDGLSTFYWVIKVILTINSLVCLLPYEERNRGIMT